MPRTRKIGVFKEIWHNFRDGQLVSVKGQFVNSNLNLFVVHSGYDTDKDLEDWYEFVRSKIMQDTIAYPEKTSSWDSISKTDIVLDYFDILHFQWNHIHVPVDDIEEVHEDISQDTIKRYIGSWKTAAKNGKVA